MMHWCLGLYSVSINYLGKCTFLIIWIEKTSMKVECKYKYLFLVFAEMAKLSRWRPFFNLNLGHRWFLKHPTGDKMSISTTLTSHERQKIKHQSPALLTDILWEESIGDGGFPSQRASNAESVSMSWRHYGSIGLISRVVPRAARNGTFT